MGVWSPKTRAILGSMCLGLLSVSDPIGLIFSSPSGDEALAQILEMGLHKAQDNGTYMKLLKSRPYGRDASAQARLVSRVRLDIANPFFSQDSRQISDRFRENN
jgi:hypothetical protein